MLENDKLENSEKVRSNQQRRSVKRRHLVFYLRVFNQSDSSVLGHVVDISSEGLMLLSDATIKVGEKFSLRMRLPIDLSDKDELQFNAVCRWCKEDGNPDFYLSGLQIDGLTIEVEEYILHLINDYSYGESL